MSDAETLPEWLVPYIEALRDRLGEIVAASGNRQINRALNAARALVDAVEQSTAGEDECEHALYVNTNRCTKCGTEVAPADPVSEAHCRCGHRVDHHFAPRNGECRWCDCKDATPAPPPTTPRDELADAPSGRLITLDELIDQREKADESTTTNLPTTPGSVIEATRWAGSVFLWMRGGRDRWVCENGRTVTDADLRLVRVLFDAGEDA